MPAAPQTSKTFLISGLQFRMLGAMALFAVAAVGGAGDANLPGSQPVAASFSVELTGADLAAALTVAPKTWSSRSQIRWDARFGSKGCYVV